MQNPRKLIARVVLPVVALALVAGCATIFNGTMQNVTVKSTPDAAKVVVTTMPGDVSVFEGQTPATFRISKTKEYQVAVAMDGYKPSKSLVSHDGVEGWFFGNLICGGLVGMIIDYADGAMWKLSPDQIQVSLQTAHIPGGGDVLYAVMVGVDGHGQLRNFAVPLERADAPAFSLRGGF